MKLCLSLFYVLCCLGNILDAQQTYYETDLEISKAVEGTLTMPDSLAIETPLVIFIMGSGPTNRDGNQAMMQNNTFRQLAHELAQQNISSFRYDKRIFKMRALGQQEQDLSFDHFVEDAKTVLYYFQDRYPNRQVTIVGHSQGALIGLLAAQYGADAYISIAGAAEPIDQVLLEQIKKQLPGLHENAKKALAELRTTGRTTSYSPGLANIFRPTTQPFMRSWMQYDPVEEIKKLTESNMPILIIQGDKDLQVSKEQGELLYKAVPNATYALVPNMNHVLKEIKGDDLENQKSYNESWRKVMPEVTESITDFVTQTVPQALELMKEPTD